jgi:hypothetical protein
MDLRPYIDDLLGQTDELLAELPRERPAVRRALHAFLRQEQPRLSAPDLRVIVAHVLAQLEADDFFPETYVDAFAPEDSAAEDDFSDSA